MKASLLLGLGILLLQIPAAGDFAKEQNTRAIQVERLIDHEGKITVYSLNPLIEPGGKSFHGYTILGSAELSAKADRQKLLSALAKSIRESDGDPFACFSPRHGLRFSVAGRTSDIVICFQCESSRAYGFKFKSFLQTGSAQSAFDDFLTGKGVKLAEKPEAEHGGADRPATAPESKPDGDEKPQPESNPSPR